MTLSASETFRRRLREERERAGVSQMELARLMTERLSARIDSTTITRMEKGERTVRLDEAVVAAEVLEVPLSELLSAQGTSLLARIDDLRFSLQGAQAALDSALAEVEQRRDKVEELTVELEELEGQERAQEKAAVEKELLEDFKVQSGPR